MADFNTSFVANVFEQELKAQVSKELQRGLGAYFESFLGSIDQSLQSKQGLAQAHQETAVKMQEATLSLYDSRVEGRKPGPSYRIGQNRLSGGVLKRALSDPAMFVGNAQGIGMGNLGVLNSEARHWYRLNFGAGEQAGGPAPRQLRFGDRAVAVSVAGPPSAPFQMPLGSFRQGESGFGFYPRSKVKRDKFSNIQGRNFFEGGLVALTEELPVAYDRMVARFVNDAKVRATAAISVER